MGRKIFLLHILLGFITFSVGTTPDVVQSSTSTSTSVSVSTVTRKVTSKPVFRLSHATVSTNGTTFTTVATPIAQIENKTHSVEDGDGVTKPLKIKKKILASNLKNSTEKVVLQNDKHDKQNLLKSVVSYTEGSESKDNGKANSSDSTEDEVEEAVFRNQNGTIEVPMNKTNEEPKKVDGIPIGGRSLESSEENANVNPRGKTKASTNTTERTTKGLVYENYTELQKVLNNNYLNNNEGYENKAGTKVFRPSPSVILPTKKSTPISTDNSLKNAIRFESEYYGPTGQTDWVPIVPDKLPARPVSGAQQFGNRLKPAPGEKANKTVERNAVVFPSDDTQGPKETNVILVKEKEAEKTTIRHRNSLEKRTRPLNNTDSPRPLTVPPNLRQPIKFRGAVRYRTQSNSTQEDKKFQNETILKRSNSTSGMDIPVTGASWTLATLKGSRRTTEKPEEITEISVVTVTNHTSKSQNAVDSSLVVPPENVKLENVTKDQPKSSSPSPVTEDVGKYNKTDKVETMPKLIEGWNTMMGKEKPGNDTDVIIPKSVDVNQGNDTTSEKQMVKTSTFAPVTVVATEITTETEAPTENTTFEVSSQSSVSNSSVELPATLVNDTLSTTEEAVGTSVPMTEVVQTTTAPVSDDDEGFTESEQTTLSIEDTIPTERIETSENSRVNVTEVTQTVEERNISSTSTSLPVIQRVTTSPVSMQVSTEMSVTESPMILTSSEPNTTPSTTPVSSTFSIPSGTTVSTTPSTTTSTIASTTTSTTTSTTSPTTAATAEATTTTFTTTTASTTTSTTSTTTTTTSTPRGFETIVETTEDSFYYKNYVPTTVNPHDEITEESVPAYLRLTVQAASWEELCRLKEELRESIMKMLGGKNVSAESVHFLNLNDRNCQEKIEESRENPTNGTIFLPVNMFLMDKNGDFDKNLSEAFLTLWGRRGLDFELPIRKVDFVTPIVNLTELADPPLGGSVVAAIVISCVAGICVILLGILFVIMKRRQKRFNYGQRCTPVSLDAYSLDSVSIYNSVRRKGMRASKRSYGNAAFDDPEVPTHKMNFAGLANFSSDKEQLYEEFNIIPQVYPKAEELPPGAETKNRYANVIPLPETRVHLTVKDGDALSDYINANYVRGPKGVEKLYIACQAPMDSTIEDFWRMVWEQQCKVILMLTDLQENGIEKCADYLPPNEVTDNLRLFGDFQVTLKKRDVKEKYIISNLILKNMEANLWREVTHLWYLGWPDQGVPSEANSLIAFLIEARSQMKIQNGVTTSSPAVVHCSPGTGRTGTVIACDLCIREYEQSRMVDIPKCVFNLRRDRAGSVQTKDQYAFIYQVLNVYATKLSGGGIESI